MGVMISPDSVLSFKAVSKVMNSPDSVLSLQAVQKAGCEVQNVLHTHLMVCRPVLSQVTCNIMVQTQSDKHNTTLLTMEQNHQVPDNSKHQPGEVERCCETEQGPGPGQVYHRGEEVL